MKTFLACQIRGLLAGLLLTVAVLVAPTAADASSNIEGVWSFNGGKVAVQSQPGGGYIGTVVEPTKFSTCFHPAGEQMWTDMREQPDGSFWGLHQWLFNDPECTPNPTLGKTAWRVIEEGTSRFLRVCFSEPGSESQPTIAADGTVAGATFGCSDSNLVSELPVVTQATASEFIGLASNQACLAKPMLKVELNEPKGDPFAKVSAVLHSGAAKRQAKLKRGHGQIHAMFNLRGLTAPKLKVSIAATTVLGQTLRAKRTYRRCAIGGKHRLKTHA